MRMTKEGEVAAHQCLEEVLHMLAGDALAVAEEAKKNKETYIKVSIWPEFTIFNVVLLYNV